MQFKIQCKKIGYKKDNIKDINQTCDSPIRKSDIIGTLPSIPCAIFKMYILNGFPPCVAYFIIINHVIVRKWLQLSRWSG